MNADLIYSFNPASTAFSIDSTNGDITVQTAADLDVETTEVFYLSVEVRDDAATSADRLTYTYTVVIELTDVNEVKLTVKYFIIQPRLHTPMAEVCFWIYPENVRQCIVNTSQVKHLCHTSPYYETASMSWLKFYGILQKYFQPYLFL